MEGSRKDVERWLFQHGEENTSVTTITFFAIQGLLDDCITQKTNKRGSAWKYDVEKAGRRILWIRQKQRMNRLRINEIRELIRQDPAKSFRNDI